MKKWLVALTVICLIIVGIAFFIPSQKKLSFSVPVNSSATAVARFLLSSSWPTWWPGTTTSSSGEYGYKGFTYKIDKQLINGFNASIVYNADAVYGSLVVLPYKTDSCKLAWSGNVNFSKNPVSRIAQYLKLKKFEHNIDDLLHALKTYFDDENNIYGARVKQIKIDETPLISTVKQFAHYPAVPEIYEVIDAVQQFIAVKNEKEMNYPMIHIHTEDSVNYDLMVAIQTGSEIQSSGIFNLKLLKQGKMLTMDVPGGPAKIQQQEAQLVNYLHDYNKMSPAIPYQLLITDRRKETDTSKWLTRLYYPVF